jgi:hypothetical protein
MSFSPHVLGYNVAAIIYLSGVSQAFHLRRDTAKLVTGTQKAIAQSRALMFAADVVMAEATSKVRLCPAY